MSLPSVEELKAAIKKKQKQPMPVQDPKKRVSNFEEVALGYSETDALLEAARCLSCKEEYCRQGCPVEIDIPRFIKQIKERDYLGALKTIKEKNNLPAICGRVCPQENQCEKLCIRGKKGDPVAIGRLERFVADYGRNHAENPSPPPQTEVRAEKVAVIGSGPAGLTAAADLARMGYQVTIFEALHAPGGVLVYGIPEFRLPKHVVQHEIDSIRHLGVEILTNIVIGRTLTVEELFVKGYRAVFIGTGAGLPYFLGIPGENLNGVYSANEFLTRVNLMKAYLFPRYLTPIAIGSKVAVVGGGNVAIDAARTALRLGAREVTIIYRRSETEMPARREEIEHAKEEGVKFCFLTNPISIQGTEDGWVKELICLRYQLGEPDSSRRRAPVPIPGSEHSIAADTVVIAIGQGPNPLVTSTTPGLETNRSGYIITNADGKTSKEGIFAGGDIVTGAATVISAMAAGKRAATAIDLYLRERRS